MTPLQHDQVAVCQRFGSRLVPTLPTAKLGVALASLDQLPINALRHPPEGDTSGWYIWGGDLSQAEDFFQPMHAIHLEDHVPSLVQYLGLEPGWRVLLAPGHEDVWFDASLVDV